MKNKDGSNALVLIADDHPIVRHGLQKAIEQQDKSAVIVHADNGAEALSILNEKPIDIAILDINMPLMDGLEVVERFKKQAASHDTKFVIFTLHKDLYYFTKGKELGFRGYLLKDFALEEIDFCLHEIMEDRCFVSNALFAELSKSKAVQQTLSSLSHREKQILGLLKDGLTSKQIGEKLLISNKSINQLKNKICAKINIPHTESALINWTFENKSLLRLG